MKIQLNTDNNVQGDASLVRHVEDTVEAALQRFSERLTRVEVHVSDMNADRAGGRDKRCLMEARLNNMQPITASDNADTVAEAVTSTAKKLQRAIETAISKASDHH